MPSTGVTLYNDDSRAVLPTLAAQSVDCVITDPPYPEINRDYGRLTEAAWWDMMMLVCKETRRILKPTGSAVFILQPNQHKTGSMRGWLWEFMAWVCRDWNMVQDAWWWNITALPNVLTKRTVGLLRPGLKACVWAGDPNCYRAQDAVLWHESDTQTAMRLAGRLTHELEYRPGGSHQRRLRMIEAAAERGGVTPFNVLPIPNADSQSSAGSNGHSAGTPLELAKWWTRYICPPGGVVCDPFMGSGTMGLAALAYGCDFIGIEKEDRPGYFPTATTRLAEAAAQPMLLRQPTRQQTATNTYQQLLISA